MVMQGFKKDVLVYALDRDDHSNPVDHGWIDAGKRSPSTKVQSVRRKGIRSGSQGGLWQDVVDCDIPEAL